MLNSAGFSLGAAGVGYVAFGPISRGRVWSGVFAVAGNDDPATAPSFGVTIRTFVGKPELTAAGFANGKPVSQIGSVADDLLSLPIGRQSYVPVDGQLDVDSWLMVRVSETGGVAMTGTVSVQTGRGSEVPSEDRQRVPTLY